MRRFIVFSLLTVIPMTVWAADSLDYLLDDAERFEQEMERMEQESDWDAVDDVEMRSPDLIPDSGREESSDREDEAVEEGISVRIKIDGVPVDLSDVPKDAWFAPYVRSAAEAGIVSGYRGEDGLPLGLYGPGDPVTIEQIAKIALAAAGVDRMQCTAALKNEEAAGRWSEEFVRCAEHLQWAVYADGSVDPLRSATRAEVIATILQAFNVEFRASDAMPFSDVDSSIEFRSAIIRAFDDHIVSGYTDANGNVTGKFGPIDPVKRAEVAKIVTLAVEVYGN